MVKNIIRWLVAMVVCCFSVVVVAESAVWRISKGDKTIFLGGTVHILAETDYPLPCEFDMAYAQSDKLVFETDMMAIQSPTFMSENVQHFFYPANDNLRNYLSDETYTDLVQFLNERNLPLDRMAQLKPGMLMSALMMNELKMTDRAALGVDAFFSRKAIADGKELIFLETPAQQVAFISQMGVDNEERFIRYLLDDLETLNTEFPLMKEAWRAGDLSALSSAEDMRELKQDFPRVYEMLITSRNNAWMTTLFELLDTPEVEFVLVGALHLPEESGLLTQFGSRQYDIEQLNGCN